MKRFVIGAATIAAMAFCAQGWAQPAPAANPPPGATAPAAPPPAANVPAEHVQPSNRMPAGGRATSERGAPGSVVRAHHRRHAAQSARHGATGGQPSAGDMANQLNQQELSQIQSGNATMNPTTTNRMSVGGRATSGGPTQ